MLMCICVSSTVVRANVAQYLALSLTRFAVKRHTIEMKQSSRKWVVHLKATFLLVELSLFFFIFLSFFPCDLIVLAFIILHYMFDAVCVYWINEVSNGEESVTNKPFCMRWRRNKREITEFFSGKTETVFY